MKTVQAAMIAVGLAVGLSAGEANANWFKEQATKAKTALDDTGKKFKTAFNPLVDALTPKERHKKDPPARKEESNPLPNYLPNLSAFLQTAAACDQVFDKLGGKVDARYKNGAAWYPATCSVEFQSGLTRGFVKSIANTNGSLRAAADAAWQHRSTCMPGGASSINGATAIPALLCDLAIVEANKVASLPVCGRSMASVFQRNGDRIAKVLTKVG
jgi:hypothetical protein